MTSLDRPRQAMPVYGHTLTGLGDYNLPATDDSKGEVMGWGEDISGGRMDQRALGEPPLMVQEETVGIHGMYCVRDLK